MKFRIYLLFAIVLLSAAFVSAKEITCYSTLNNSWYVTEGDLCPTKLFDVNDLNSITLNFDRTDCATKNAFCGGMDINRDGKVNGNDLALFTPSLCVENCTVTAVCGDYACDASENCSTCAADCGTCPKPKPKPSGGGGGGGSPRPKPVVNVTSDSTSGTVSFDVKEDSENANENDNSDSVSFEGNSNEENSNIQESKNEEPKKGVAATGMATGADGEGGNIKLMFIILVVVLLALISIIIYIKSGKHR